ncbi:MAG TPA: type III-B CRISPR-associated protein Cas10/Cmr2 [Candidatus Binataceae bacterium]|nr:type III-B CRISPR-associated protein Cas10/Cmr2 [Candidatus Binataceae bacterium]
MSGNLLALSVGPVQEFISAARRTRDLWFGSYLLSEISKAAAKAVKAHGKLIFPAPLDDAQLDRDSFNVANIILAKLSQFEPEQVAHAAKAAAQQRWRGFARSVLTRYQDVIRQRIWEEQIDDVIEFYAAWHPYAPESYSQDRAALMRLLAARKLCRDFVPAKGHAGIPKSSLDGLRESVLLKERLYGHRRPLRLSEGEELDVVGLVKRTWGPEGQVVHYPSVARVAADPWLRGAEQHLSQLKQACAELAGRRILNRLDVSPGGHPHYALFPFEGTAVFRSRHPEFIKETEIKDQDLNPLRAALTELIGQYGEPSPYLAVLVADGDRMGQALSRLDLPNQHRNFSRALASFASNARDIVNAHSGVMVYAGGDDVLAFLPVDRCLGCARALHDAFGDALAGKTAKGAPTPTLSVGLAIAHFMEPLEDLLDYGRQAEKHAKHPHPEDGQQGDRDGLAVHVVKRGRGPVGFRANWSENPDQHLARLAGWMRSAAISGRVAYDLRKLAEVYDAWTDRASLRDAIQRDALLLMAGKRTAGTAQIDAINELIRERVTDAGALRTLVNELLIARQIGAAMRQAEPNSRN